MNRTLTSGLFPVETAGVPLSPEAPEAFHPYTLFIFFENFSNDLQLVTELPDREIEGRRLEITLRLPPSLVIPSAAIIETALADGSTSLALWIGPGEFSRVVS